MGLQKGKEAFFLPVDSRTGAELWEHPNGDVWSVTSISRVRRVGIFRRNTDGSYRLNEDSVRSVATFSISHFQAAEDGAILIAGLDGVIRFDPRAADAARRPFAALIRSVQPFSGDAVFGGDRVPGTSVTSLHFDQNSLRFELQRPCSATRRKRPISTSSKEPTAIGVTGAHKEAPVTAG